MSGRNWNKARHESQVRRYGAEQVTPRSQQGQPGINPGTRRKRARTPMTPEQRKKWADAIAKVYGKVRK